MVTYLERMQIERDELSTKCDALLKFMGSDVFLAMPKNKRDLMSEQYDVMRDYLLVLSKRINLE
jgi:hypothetical protein